MNDQSFNPQENAQNTSYNPQGDAGAQQPQGNPNPQGGPGAGQSSAGQSAGDQSQQSGPQQPPPNPQKMAEDQFAEELKQAWIEFERINAAAEEMSKRGDITQDVISKIKQSANEKLSKKITQATERFSHKTNKQAQGSSQSTFSSSASAPFSNKLYRSDSDKMLAGVCGGLAEYFGIDSSWIRVIFVILCVPGFPITFFLAVFAYIAFSVILPVKTNTGEFRRMF